MADLTVTSASISPGTAAITRNVTAGAACTVGYAGYLDASGYVQHADANAGETESRGIGILVSSKDGETSITSGDQCSIVVFGPVYGFTSVTPGAPVYVSTNAGRLTHTKPTGGAYQRSIGYGMPDGTGIFVLPCSDDPASA